LKIRSLAALCLLLAGCRQGLYNQQKVRPYRESTLFADGSGMRPIPAGTVARGHLRDDKALYAGVGPDGKLLNELPVPLSKQLLLRGQERFNIYCSPCHGRTGNGVGMIVRRGFKKPASFHIDRLKNERVGYFFDVMTHGFGQMSSYASQVSAGDRWAIAAYLRALQLSQAAPAAMLSDADRKELEGAPRAHELSAVGEGDVTAMPQNLRPDRGPVETSGGNPEKARGTPHK